MNKHLDSIFPSRDQFFRPFEDFINRCYDEMFSEHNLTNFIKNRGGYPKLDIFSKGDLWIIEVACPGMTHKDVEVTIVPDQKSGSKFVKIKGQLAEGNEHEGATYYVKELSRSSFERIVRLPEGLAKSAYPEANMQNGKLTLIWEFQEKDVETTKKVQIYDFDTKKQSTPKKYCGDMRKAEDGDTMEKYYPDEEMGGRPELVNDPMAHKQFHDPMAGKQCTPQPLKRKRPTQYETEEVSGDHKLGFDNRYR